MTHSDKIQTHDSATTDEVKTNNKAVKEKLQEFFDKAKDLKEAPQKLPSTIEEAIAQEKAFKNPLANFSFDVQDMFTKLEVVSQVCNDLAKTDVAQQVKKFAEALESMIKHANSFNTNISKAVKSDSDQAYKEAYSAFDKDCNSLYNNYYQINGNFQNLVIAGCDEKELMAVLNAMFSFLTQYEQFFKSPT